MAAYSPSGAGSSRSCCPRCWCVATKAKYYRGGEDKLERRMLDENGALSVATRALRGVLEHRLRARADLAACPVNRGRVVCSLCCSLNKHLRGTSPKKPAGGPVVDLTTRRPNAPLGVLRKTPDRRWLDGCGPGGGRVPGLGVGPPFSLAFPLNSNSQPMHRP